MFFFAAPLPSPFTGRPVVPGPLPSLRAAAPPSLRPYLFLHPPNSPLGYPPPLRPAFTRHRYANMWFSTRIWRLLEPSIVLVVSIWLAYGSWEHTRDHAAAAAALGALLVANFVVAAALLAAGLVWGGAWRKLPAFLSWPCVQVLEALPAVLDAFVLSHWARLIGRTVSTPVYAMLHTITCVLGGRGGGEAPQSPPPAPPCSPGSPTLPAATAALGAV